MSQTSVSSGAMHVCVRDQHGVAQPIYEKNGRLYVKAVHGLKYTPSAVIYGSGRYEFLCGIDGRDTLKNQPADLLFTRGLVISGYDRYDVPGWGKDATTPFIFTAFDRQTIAMRATGSNKNLGVIAFAYFREYVRPRPQIDEYLFRGSPVAKGGLESFSFGPNMRGAGMGTGTDETDVTHRKLGTTSFTRANDTTPDGLIEIYAMPQWWLEEEGILPERPAHDKNHPQGFGHSDHSDYGLR